VNRHSLSGRRRTVPRTLLERRAGSGVHRDAYEFGQVTIDGVSYDKELVIEHGTGRKRRKSPSKGHARPINRSLCEPLCALLEAVRPQFDGVRDVERQSESWHSRDRSV
jgi:hypothetical protein